MDWYKGKRIEWAVEFNKIFLIREKNNDEVGILMYEEKGENDDW